MKNRLVCGVMAVGVTGGACLAGGSDFVVPYIRDFDMPVANWSQFVAPGSFGGFSYSVGQSPTGGVPVSGAYRTVTHSSTAGQASGTLIHVSPQTWTPLVRGPIGLLHMTVDVNCFNGGTSGAVGFGFVVVQGGVIYYGPSFAALTNSDWRNDLRVLNMTAADFNGPMGSHPNFTVNGGLVAFGFYTSNGTASGTPISSSSGVDNFFVTIGTVTQPLEPCGTADIGQQGGVSGPDGALDNNDFVVFIDYFFAGSGAADYGAQGGVGAPDGSLDNNDFIVFIDRFFGGC
jgi:hypothetical protein